jgi:excisionase family DNA binding protein
MERDTIRDRPDSVASDKRDSPRYGPRTVPEGDHAASRDVRWDRMTVTEAAEMLGVTQSAIRKRIQRGTIPWDKDAEGRVYVYVDPSEERPETGDSWSRDPVPGQSRDDLLEAYKEQVEFLRQELERKDTIIMSLTQRIPELEAAPEPRESPVSAPEGRVGTEEVPPEDQGREKPSWWHRLFYWS